MTIGGFNLYNVVQAVRGGKYVYNCIVVEKNGAEKCIKNILDRIDEYVAGELNLQGAAFAGRAGLVETHAGFQRSSLAEIYSTLNLLSDEPRLPIILDYACALSQRDATPGHR